METRVGELIRLGILVLVGAYLMFGFQPGLYNSGTIPVTDVDINVWVSSSYMLGATIVFAVSFISAILWYFIASTANLKGSGDVSRTKWLWYIFLFVSVVSIFVGVYLTSSSQEARWSLIGLFSFNVFLVFWLATAISSPKSLKFAPLGSFFIRRLISQG